MRKFIFIFILSILTVSFAAFLINAYVLRQNYFGQNIFDDESENKTEDQAEVSVTSSYLGYSKEVYDKYLTENKVTVLFFTSNWCSKCVEQDAENKKVFEDLNLGNVSGFSIHILDSETTVESDAIAKKFDVTKENTFLFLDKNGAVDTKYTGNMTKEMLKNKIMEVFNK